MDGKRHDLEMHTVHVASETLNGFGYAAMGIIFSVNDSTIVLDEADQKVVDDFFDGLLFSSYGNVTVSNLGYGDLMMMVNTKDRWVYKGSVTTPPCATSVYWNVLRTIYPVKQSTLDNFKRQLDRNPGLEKLGNWREIQPLTTQSPRILTSYDPMLN